MAGKPYTTPYSRNHRFGVCQTSASILTSKLRGYEHDSCGLCKQCLTGWEIYCPERQMYGAADLDQGSFASHAVWREAFLFKLPDELSDADCAPLYVVFIFRPPFLGPPFHSL